MLLVKLQGQLAHLQIAMRPPSSALAAIGRKVLHRHAQRHAGIAMRARGAVAGFATAPKTLLKQSVVNRAAYSINRHNHLRASLLLQIAAIVGFGSVKLQMVPAGALGLAGVVHAVDGSLMWFCCCFLSDAAFSLLQNRFIPVF